MYSEPDQTSKMDRFPNQMFDWFVKSFMPLTCRIKNGIDKCILSKRLKRPKRRFDFHFYLLLRHKMNYYNLSKKLETADYQHPKKSKNIHDNNHEKNSFQKLSYVAIKEPVEKLSNMLKGQEHPSKVFNKKGILKSFTKSTGKYMCQSLSFNKFY